MTTRTRRSVFEPRTDTRTLEERIEDLERGRLAGRVEDGTRE